MISGVKKERGRTAGASSQFVPHISFRIMLEGGGVASKRKINIRSTMFLFHVVPRVFVIHGSTPFLFLSGTVPPNRYQHCY